MTAGNCIFIFTIIKNFARTSRRVWHREVFNTFLGPLCIHRRLLMCGSFSFMTLELRYFMVTRFAPATLGPFTGSALGGKTPRVWVSRVYQAPACRALACLPPGRGQRRQPVPASARPRDFGCQEAAGGAPAAGRGTTRVSGEHLDQRQLAGCQSHKNNPIAPAQQRGGQESNGTEGQTDLERRFK